MEIRGKTAIVTGGTGGLGRRICLTLAKAGANVALVYLKSQTEAEGFAAELCSLGPQVIAIQADITSQAGIDTMIQTTLRKFGRVDALVNDAAYNRFIAYQDLDTLDEDVWNHILHSNLTSPFLAMRAIAGAMTGEDGGRIVNVASIAGLNPSGSSIAYAVSKAGLIHLTRCMAVALAPRVLVNCVAPGFLEGTRMSDNLPPEFQERARQSSALRKAADKDDVADAVLTLIRTNSITGQTLVVDAGRVFH
ncbi:MAG TPA: SDR family oxidoreductase [Chloroflexota bacterium]|nr:SDR family oxidoreductase [Chloroflexota bacterium]